MSDAGPKRRFDARYLKVQPGQRYGHLLVLRRCAPSEETRNDAVQWVCLCDCGAICFPVGPKLTRGVTKSCGCLRAIVAKRVNTRHGGSARSALGGRCSKEYVAWCNIKSRCSNPRNKAWNDYGGKGVRICGAWAGSFDLFLSDIGESPSPSQEVSVDRIDTNGHYSCGKCRECRENSWTFNCRWADNITQANNKTGSRKLDFCGEMLTIAQIARKVGMKYATLWRRLTNGCSVHDATSRPLHERKKNG